MIPPPDFATQNVAGFAFGESIQPLLKKRLNKSGGWMEKRVGQRCLSIFLLALSGGAVMAQVRTPEVAGQFYPADPKELKKTVLQFLTAAPESPLEGEPIALLSPHAGYLYSGSVEGYSYRSVREIPFDTVVVLGTAHYFPTQKVSGFDG